MTSEKYEELKLKRRKLLKSIDTLINALAEVNNNWEEVDFSGEVEVPFDSLNQFISVDFAETPTLCKQWYEEVYKAFNSERNGV